MRKTTILLGVLSLEFSYAQQGVDLNGKVGVNTETSKETLDVRGTMKVQELPE